jgi:ABC-2 type transport system permease protein
MNTTLALGYRCARLDIKRFLRNRAAVIFTLAFPIMFLVLFGLIFNGKIDGTNVEYSQLLVTSIMASSLASVTFVSLAITVCTERDTGELKRLAGTPMPKAAYFFGKVGQVLAISVVEVALVMAIGLAAFKLHLPTSAGRWITFLWVFLLSVIACTLLGIAMSSVPRNAKAAPAIVNLPFVGLQFISGIFVPFTQLPKSLRTVAGFFPLKWMAQGMRSVFLPDSFARVESAGSWEHGRTALVLGIWVIVGAVLCLRTFRWTRDGR